MFDIDIYDKKMDLALEHMKKQFVKIKTGVANPMLVSDIKVKYYEEMTPLFQIANIFAPEPHLLAIKPYDQDQTVLNEIVHAINSENIGLHAVIDAPQIKITIPKLTQETRKDLVKKVSQYKEGAKILIRNIRREANDALKKDEDLTEDIQKKYTNDVQKLTDKYVKKIDELYLLKEKDLMSI